MTEDQDAAHLKTLTVLYVEDDPGTREEIGIFLKRRVGTLLTASGGAEGLARFQPGAVHIAVTDIQMPGMDGLALAEALRKLDPGLPILVTTAFEEPDYLMRAIDLGVDGYLLKPVQCRRLESALLAQAHRLLAEAQLRLRRRLEAEAQRQRHQAAIGILLGGIAHDYNNLLQSILAAATLARFQVDPDSEAARVLDILESCSGQAKRLSTRLATLARPTAEVDRTAPLEPLVLEAVSRILEGSTLRPDFAFQEDPPPVDHGAADLREVFESLARNALEATDGGGVLRVSSRTLAVLEGEGVPPGDYVQVTFADPGRGIPASDLPMVFEPYFSTKDRGTRKGVGLGLALCDAILRAHGGAVSAESRPGEGATFQVLLPVRREPPPSRRAR